MRAPAIEVELGRRLARLFALGILLPVGAASAQPQPAPPLPLAQARGDLDGDGRPDEVRLERDGRMRVLDGAGRELGQLALAAPAAELRDADAQVIAVDAHRSVAHVRARLGGVRSVEAVLAVERGGVRALFNQRTGPLGDGERALHVRVDAAGVVRYQTSPGYERCDGEARIYPERWDFRSGRFRPVSIDPPVGGSPLPVWSVGPQDLAGEPLGVFHFIAESTAADAERRADRLASPVELEDHKPETLWRAGPPGLGKGAWVTARAEGPGHRLRALRVVPGPGEPPDLMVILDGGVKFTVENDKPGPFWIVPPDAPRTSCVSIVIAEPPDAAGSPGTALAEVALYSELDGASGVAELVAQVAAMGPGSDAAARVLVGLGARAVTAIATALPTAHGAGHRRLVEVLAQLDAPEAAAALGRALETAAEGERRPIVAGLERLGARGAAEAERIYRDAGAAPDARADAAEVLGARASDPAGAPALAALLDGAGRDPQAARAATVKALARAAAASPEVARALAAALASSGADAQPRLADLARALGSGARQSPARAEAAAALAAALARATEFDARLRLERAAGDLGAPALAPALDGAARSQPDEILRWAAVEAAAALDGGAGRATLEAALADADPRVRRAALVGLGAHPDEKSASAQIAALGRDGWPLVRVAAAEGLQGACAHATSEAANAALARAVVGEPGKREKNDAAPRGADGSEEVRRAALSALGRCAPSHPAIAEALRSRRQPLGVRELAAALLGAHPQPGAAAAVAAALDDVLTDPAADERYAGLAIACLRALTRLGDTSRPILESLGSAAHQPLSAAVRAAAMETIGRLCPEGAAAAFGDGVQDSDPSVRRAAEQARARCKR